jgi:hypothetical protein
VEAKVVVCPLPSNVMKVLFQFRKIFQGHKPGLTGSFNITRVLDAVVSATSI